MERIVQRGGGVQAREKKKEKGVAGIFIEYTVYTVLSTVPI